MQRILFILAYFFICVNCLSQQYSFVHYTPKDGLVNSRVRKAYQDSKGRMYFLTFGGMSVFDGARFKNYTVRDGLAVTLVNDILETGNDTLLVATNSGNYLNVLVKGKLEKLNNGQPGVPVVNQFYRHDNGKIYLSSDDGLFLLENKKINELNVTPLTNLSNITGTGNWLVASCNEMKTPQGFYLYDIRNNRVVDSISKTIYLLGKDENNQIWVSSGNQLFILDTAILATGKLSLIFPPGNYRQSKDYPAINLVFGKNCVWFIQRNKEFRNSEIHIMKEPGTLLKIPLPEKAISSVITNIFIDRENTIWICNDGEGVFKLVNSPLQVTANPFGNSLQGYIDDAYYIDNTTWFSTNTNKFFRKVKNEQEEFVSNINPAPEIFYAHKEKLMAHDYKTIYEGSINSQKNTIFFHPEIQIPNADFFGKKLMMDPNNNIIAIQETGLAVWKNNKRLFHFPLEKPDLIDGLFFDKNNLLWSVKRYSGIDVFKLHPEDDSNYLQRVFRFSRDQIVGSPRCAVADKSGLIWIGTREDGVVCYRHEENRLQRIHAFNADNGLTDNFVTSLACDSLNNIIVGTQTGLDRVLRIDENISGVENLSKNSNFFSLIYQVWADAHHAYARSYSGALLQLFPPENRNLQKTPQLLLEDIRVNAHPVSPEKNNFRWNENNISFSVAAPSFIDEKQVLFSYVVEGSGNRQWSDTAAANAVINLTNLSPGDYLLKVKAFFPSATYAPVDFSYSFEITPPWWQTWWFRVIMAAIGAAVLILLIRLYYQRKLESQKQALERQQAIEKERTRIATDMHDDLGAGLSRIKFLSETIGIKKQLQQSFDEEISSIRNYSHEMIDKMGEIVWALNEKNDTLSDLLSYTRAYAVEYLSQNGIYCRVETPEQFPVSFVSGEFRRNIFLTIKEALHNIVKHAQATEVEFTIRADRYLSVRLRDNGTGFDRNKVRSFSNGLTNMETRIREIGGSIAFFGDKGTLVDITVPLQQ